jgi:hypothetical protein
MDPIERKVREKVDRAASLPMFHRQFSFRLDTLDGQTPVAILSVSYISRSCGTDRAVWAVWKKHTRSSRWRMTQRQIDEPTCVRCGNCCRDAIFGSLYSVADVDRWKEEGVLKKLMAKVTKEERRTGRCVFLKNGEPASCSINDTKPTYCAGWEPGRHRKCRAKVIPRSVRISH